MALRIGVVTISGRIISVHLAIMISQADDALYSVHHDAHLSKRTLTSLSMEPLRLADIRAGWKVRIFLIVRDAFGPCLLLGSWT